MDNVLIKRLWRPLKYESNVLTAFETGGDARTGVGRWINYTTPADRNSTFSSRTPDEVYASQVIEEKLAA